MENAILKNKSLQIKSRTHGASLSQQQLEMRGCVLSSVATDALVLKHQGISFHSIDLICTVLVHIYTEIL